MANLVLDLWNQEWQYLDKRVELRLIRTATTNYVMPSKQEEAAVHICDHAQL